MLSLLWPLLFIGALLYLAYRRASLGQATLVLGALLLGYTLWGEGGPIWTSILWVLFAPVALLNLPPLRLTFVSRATLSRSSRPRRVSGPKRLSSPTRST